MVYVMPLRTHSRDLFCCMSTAWRSSTLSEEELSELPECVLCERLVRRAERGVNVNEAASAPHRHTDIIP